MDATYTLVITLLGLFFLIILSGKWFIFGIKFFFAKVKYKDNLGLMFERGLGGNYTLPKLIDLTKLKHETTDSFQPLARDMFRGIRVFGCPCVFLDSEDATVSNGLFKRAFNIFKKEKEEVRLIKENITAAQVLLFRKVEARVKETENQEDPYTIEEATHILTIRGDDGKPQSIDTKIPYLIEEKPSYRVPKEVLKQAIIQSGFTAVLDLFNKNSKFILILAGVAALASVFAAYVSFQNGNNIALVCGEQIQNNLLFCKEALNATLTRIP